MKLDTNSLWQYRTIWQEDSARIFVPIQSLENRGILCVFPILQTKEVRKKGGRDLQAQLCGVALEKQGNHLSRPACMHDTERWFPSLYSLTAPKDIPEPRFLCVSTVNRMVGSRITIPAVAIICHSFPLSPMYVIIARGSVFAFLLVRFMAYINSFHEKQKDSTAVAAIPGLHIGSTIKKKARICDAPSSYADSSINCGTSAPPASLSSKRSSLPPGECAPKHQQIQCLEL